MTKLVWHDMNYAAAVTRPQDFASKVYSDLAADGFPLIVENDPHGAKKYKEALTRLREGVDDPATQKLIDDADERMYDFAINHWSAGITFGIAVEGFRRSLLQLSQVACPSCKGSGTTGMVAQYDPAEPGKRIPCTCSTCGGDGYVPGSAT